MYIDDILVFSENEEGHIRCGLKLHPSKCTFAQSSVGYLGYTVSGKGIEPDPNKVKAVQEFPVPTTVRGVRRFLGMTGYYRRFMAGFAKIAAPLHALTRESVPFFWSIACQGAFQALKDLLVTPPVLAYPNFDRDFILHTDASIGSGGCPGAGPG